MTHAAPLTSELTAAAPLRRDIAALAALVTWAALLHWPSRRLWGVDDAFYLEAGRLWLHGLAPYANAFDVKPPGFFALLALAEALLGASTATLSTLATICDAGTAICLWRIGRRIGAPQAGIFAAWAYPPLSITLADNPGYPPLAFATSLAFWAACGPGSLMRRAALAGLAIGVAGTIKQTAAFEAPALVLVFARAPEASAARGRALVAFVGAAAMPALVFALGFASAGLFPVMFEDAVRSAWRRPGLINETLSDVVAHFRRVLLPISPLLALAAWGGRVSATGPARGALAAWSLAAFAELAVQHARWMNYVGPTLAPTLLLVGVAVGARPVLRALAVANVAALGLVSMGAQISASDDAAQTLAQAAAIVTARAPGPQDRLLGFGDGAHLNAALDLRPPTRVFHYMHLLCDFPGAGPDSLGAALAARPRFVVAPVAAPPVFCETAGAQAAISQTLGLHYLRIGEAAVGTARPLAVYERLAGD